MLLRQTGTCAVAVTGTGKGQNYCFATICDGRWKRKGIGRLSLSIQVLELAIAVIPELFEHKVADTQSVLTVRGSIPLKSSRALVS